MSLISYPLNDERKEAVRQLLEAFGNVWPESHYGPMHILIDDYNALDHNLRYCRSFTQAMLNGDEIFVSESGSKAVLSEFEPHDENELKASLLLIDILALIPQEQRDIHDWADEFEEDEDNA